MRLHIIIFLDIKYFQDEEHHTDNESDEIITEEPPITEEVNTVPSTTSTRVSFGSLAATIAATPVNSKSSFLSDYKPPVMSPPTDSQSHTEDEKKSGEEGGGKGSDEIPTDEVTPSDECSDIGQWNDTDDSLSELSESEMDNDPTHRMALEYYNKYSKGELDWCSNYPELGPECRNCRQKGNCSFPCDNPPKYQCKLCGGWTHKERYCPDKLDIEYKKNFNIPCVYCSKKVGGLSI